jgi:hypothetical protein
MGFLKENIFSSEKFSNHVIKTLIGNPTNLDPDGIWINKSLDPVPNTVSEKSLIRI